MNAWDKPGYLTLWEALQLTISLSCAEGPSVADLVPNKWYASDLRRHGDRAAAIFDASCKRLDAWLIAAEVHGVGNTFSNRAERDISEAEWGTRWIDFAESKLTGPSGTEFPAIINVRVRSKDIRRLCSASPPQRLWEPVYPPSGRRAPQAVKAANALLEIYPLEKPGPERSDKQVWGEIEDFWGGAPTDQAEILFFASLAESPGGRTNSGTKSTNNALSALLAV